MGYYTDFTVSIAPQSPENMDEDQFESVLSELTILSGYSFDPEGNARSIKWYDYEEDMKIFSTLYPNHIFLVEGDGEESGDVWKHYFKNGKSICIQPTLSWPEVDFSTLD